MVGAAQDREAKDIAKENCGHLAGMVRAAQGAGRPNRLCQRPLWPPLNKRLPLFIITMHHNMFDQDDRNLEIKALQDQMMRLLRVNFGSKVVSVKHISI